MHDGLLVEVVRGGIVESAHRGSVVVLDTAGAIATELGDISSPMYPRSALKPLQAAAMVREGLSIEPRLLALAAASHSGSAWHVAGVEEMLAQAGLHSDDLQCIAGMPLGAEERAAYVRDGGKPDRVHFNCSGKHAGFMATSVGRGWDVARYLEAAHPMQLAARAVVEELCEERIGSATVDGCGAPLFAVSLAGLARGFRAIAIADPDTPEGQVATAMRAYPEMVGGVGREDTVAMQLMPGLIAKIGAEAVYAMALPDGRACAIKISDGAARGHQPVLREVLSSWGMNDALIAKIEVMPVLGGGQQVGGMRLAAAAAEALRT